MKHHNSNQYSKMGCWYLKQQLSWLYHNIRSLNSILTVRPTCLQYIYIYSCVQPVPRSGNRILLTHRNASLGITAHQKVTMIPTSKNSFVCLFFLNFIWKKLCNISIFDINQYCISENNLYCMIVVSSFWLEYCIEWISQFTHHSAVDNIWVF